MARLDSRELKARRRVDRATLRTTGMLILAVGALGLASCRSSGNATITTSGTPAPTIIPTLVIVTPTPPGPEQTSQNNSAAPTTPAVANPTPNQTNNGADGSYTVQPGDTLYTIAVKYNVTIQALMAANSISDPASLQAGQVIVIPQG